MRPRIPSSLAGDVNSLISWMAGDSSPHGADVYLCEARRGTAQFLYGRGFYLQEQERSAKCPFIQNMYFFVGEMIDRSFAEGKSSTYPLCETCQCLFTIRRNYFKPYHSIQRYNSISSSDWEVLYVCLIIPPRPPLVIRH